MSDQPPDPATDRPASIGASTDRAYEIYARLLEDGVVFLGDPIDDRVANLLIAQLLFLAAKRPGLDITMYIDSPGGVVTSSLALYDTMRGLQATVSTICIGTAGGTAALLLAAGTPGKRVALAGSEIVMTSTTVGPRAGDPNTQIKASDREALDTLIHALYAECTGQSAERIANDTQREHQMTPEEALEYGIVDEVSSLAVPTRSHSRIEPMPRTVTSTNDRLECPACLGRRAVGWCPECGGAGWLVDESAIGHRKPHPWESRFTANGITCPRCHGARAFPCHRCGGSGYR